MVNEIIAALIIAIVQGLTEWLPVSSSGHLVLFEKLLGFEGGLFFNVALHFGTLMAVFVYFGKDITDILQDVFRGKFKEGNGKLGLLVIMATIPAAIIGFVFEKVFVGAFDSLLITGFGFAVTGVFLIICSTGFMFIKKGNKFSWKESLGVGFFQIFALFPGISRSGSTIGSGLLFGLNEKEAVKFSFLMSIPIILGANILSIGDKALPAEMIWATIVSFVVGLGAIHLLYKYALKDRKSLKWFGIYALLIAFVSIVLSFIL